MEVLEEDDQGEPGAGWLDEADAALESFMQEDALLEAIQNAPEPEAKVQSFEVDASAVAGHGASSADSQASHAARGGGAPAAAVSLVQIPVRAERSTAELLSRDDGITSSSGPKERRIDTSGDSHRLPASRQPEVGSPTTPTKLQPRGRPNALPLLGAILSAIVVIAMVVWETPGLWESDQQAVREAPLEPRPIQLPAVGADADLDQANATAVGVRRGSIGVRWSSDAAGNHSLPLDAAAAAATAGEPPRGDHGRRQRMRAKGGTSALH